MDIIIFLFMFYMIYRAEDYSSQSAKWRAMVIIPSLALVGVAAIVIIFLSKFNKYRNSFAKFLDGNSHYSKYNVNR